MIEIILLFSAGIFIGLFFRRKARVIYWMERGILWSIFLLLFLLGLSIGLNPEIMQTLPSLGVRALVLTLGGVAGSLLAALLLWKLFFRKTI